MSNKRKVLSFFGVVGATVLAAGGSAFLTNTALSLVEQTPANVQQTEGMLNTKETELPITVETFAKTKDSFVVKAKASAAKPKKDPAKETEPEKKNETGSTPESDGASSDVSGNATDNGSTGGSSSGGNYYIEEEGYHVDAEGTTYYADGNGNLYYPDGNGDYYWAAGPGDGNGQAPSGTVPPSNNSQGGSTNSNAWDDSYMLYDIDSRYISADELSGWSANDLATLRNEIFARHGRIFTKQKWIDYFSQKTWYVPTYDAGYFDDNMGSFLNDCEWKNLDVILKLEDQLG